MRFDRNFRGTTINKPYFYYKTGVLIFLLKDMTSGLSTVFDSSSWC